MSKGTLALVHKGPARDLPCIVRYLSGRSRIMSNMDAFVGCPTDRGGGGNNRARSECGRRLRSGSKSTSTDRHRMCGNCAVTCPICNRPLRPELTDRALYCILSDGNGPVRNVRAYTCGPKGHIIIISEDGRRLPRPAQPQDGKQGSAKILNGWKEIALYLGRGVRTVQRWETRAGLPVHRPQGQDRSAVVAFAEELHAWLVQTPVRALDGTASGSTAPNMVPGATPAGPQQKGAPSGVR